MLVNDNLDVETLGYRLSPKLFRGSVNKPKVFAQKRKSRQVNCSDLINMTLCKHRKGLVLLKVNAVQVILH